MLGAVYMHMKDNPYPEEDGVTPAAFVLLFSPLRVAHPHGEVGVRYERWRLHGVLAAGAAQFHSQMNVYRQKSLQLAGISPPHISQSNGWWMCCST